MAGVYVSFENAIYGSGLRLEEALSLRITDIDFAQNQLIICDTKGKEDRGYGSVYLPYVLAQKYPKAEREWIWQYVFPSYTLSQDPRSSVTRRREFAGAESA